MPNNRVLDSGYVVYFPDTDEYFGSDVGIFKTKRGAERRAEWWKRRHNCKVRKVEIVLADEDDNQDLT